MEQSSFRQHRYLLDRVLNQLSRDKLRYSSVNSRLDETTSRRLRSFGPRRSDPDEFFSSKTQLSLAQSVNQLQKSLAETTRKRAEVQKKLKNLEDEYALLAALQTEDTTLQLHKKLVKKLAAVQKAKASATARLNQEVQRLETALATAQASALEATSRLTKQTQQQLMLSLLQQTDEWVADVDFVWKPSVRRMYYK